MEFVKNGLIKSIRQAFRKLIAAGTKESRRGPLQKLDIELGMDLSRKVDILFIKKALNSVKHSIYLVKAALYCVLVYASKTGIDYRCGASGLSYNNISFLCHYGIPPLFQLIIGVRIFSFLRLIIV